MLSRVRRTSSAGAVLGFLLALTATGSAEAAIRERVAATTDVPHAGVTPDAVPARAMAGTGAAAATTDASRGGVTAGTATDAARAELAAWEARLTGIDPAAREAAVLALAAVSPRLLPAIAERLAILERADDDAKRGFDRALRRVRRAEGLNEAAGKRASSATPSSDAFVAIMSTPRPSDPGWRMGAVTLGLSRMLTRVGSLASVRELIALYAAFGDSVRRDVEQQLRELGEKAVAALIEARRGDVRALRPWALRQLDALGKTVPGEAVQTSDNQVIADVLRAYGRTKDTDAARVIVSFASSDRALVREAARDAVTSLGESGLWQLRESYEDALGKKPPEAWSWRKLADELFAAHDRVRLADAEALVQQGLSAQRSGNLAAMAQAFDAALSRAPALDQTPELARGYITYANSLSSGERPRAIVALRRAVSLDPSGPMASSARSRIATLEADELAQRGVIDRSLYAEAVQLDPSNEVARRALLRLDARNMSGLPSWVARFAPAAILALLAAIGAAVALRGRRPSVTI